MTLKTRIGAQRGFWLLVALAGCSAPPPAHPGSQAGRYSCVPTDRKIVLRQGPRLVGIQPAPNGNVVLQQQGRPDLVLQPVHDASSGLFADQTYAWRGNGGHGVLTDAEKIMTYDCLHIEAPEAKGS